ncbi:uncharacterized protein [Arachis hypogaea]|uniref:uncharacterized protein n=1 Tax=Arachis hypogaea TaxID=3818 RepID=UPI003B212763
MTISKISATTSWLFRFCISAVFPTPFIPATPMVCILLLLSKSTIFSSALWRVLYPMISGASNTFKMRSGLGASKTKLEFHIWQSNDEFQQLPQTPLQTISDKHLRYQPACQGFSSNLLCYLCCQISEIGRMG